MPRNIVAYAIETEDLQTTLNAYPTLYNVRVYDRQEDGIVDYLLATFPREHEAIQWAEEQHPGVPRLIRDTDCPDCTETPGARAAGMDPHFGCECDCHYAYHRLVAEIEAGGPLCYECGSRLVGPDLSWCTNDGGCSRYRPFPEDDETYDTCAWCGVRLTDANVVYNSDPATGAREESDYCVVCHYDAPEAEND